jgi:hypothetical protein
MTAKPSEAPQCKLGFVKLNRLDCPNMKLRENDKDWSGENYDCKVCYQHVWLDYEEMK